jgi:hypothetical protein
MALLLLAACTRSPSDTPPDTPTARTGGSAADLQSEVIRLEAKLRNLASATGCDAAAQCKTAPVGDRACGGPREYVVYCPATTDETALLAVVDSLKQAELRHNEKTGAVSTCEFRTPPGVEISEGACRASGDRE